MAPGAVVGHIQVVAARGWLELRGAIGPDPVPVIALPPLEGPRQAGAVNPGSCAAPHSLSAS